MHRSLLVGLSALALAQAAPAQSIDWLTMARDNARLAGAANTLLSDTQERDYAAGDLDGDGAEDLVIVRKQRFMTEGRRANVLLLNEGGVLVDRTNLYATASDVPGDLGFETPTNDRDVILVDVDLDGWLDVVTATTLSDGQPKAISHPRVYRNLGADGQGNWLGLRHEDARIPQLFTAGGTATFPRFCGLAAGDVTGDGYPDLFFADYDGGPGATTDLNDRLLVNDGAGNFIDESTLRMTVQMRASGFGTSAAIVDVNGDGVNDVIKNTGIGVTPGNARVDALYNDPNAEGFFNIRDTINDQNPYHVVVGDLNRDARPDFVTSDDFADRYVLNTGVDALGRATWSTPYTFDGDTNTFTTTSHMADMNEDGFPEVFVCDMDPIFDGCFRRTHFFHNRGGTVGGFVDMGEESGGGFVGASGMTAADLNSIFDVCALDIDLDGDKDLVIGRCTGTDVWLNQSDPRPRIGTNHCMPAPENSTGQPAYMTANGSTDVLDNELVLTASALPPNQFGYVLGSQMVAILPPGGVQGWLCIGGPIGRFNAQVQSSGTAGVIVNTIDLTALPSPLPQAVLAGDTWHFQLWYRDLNPGPTSNFTDAVAVEFE